MMELLITPAQVAESVFRAPDFISPDAVSEATILAAQQKFIRPVLGKKLYESLCSGIHPDLLGDYIARPLALYVKMLMLPSLAVQTGMAGVVEATSKNLVKASEVRLRAARRRLRSDASALVRRAVEHIESHPGKFPEYDPRDNILNRCVTDGSILIG